MLYDTPNALQTLKTLKKKKGDARTDEQTNGRTNLVTMSLLELLVAAKNPLNHNPRGNGTEILFQSQMSFQAEHF